MAIKTDTELKTYFETGDVPTEAQYTHLIDSKRSVLDEVPKADVEHLAPLESVISGTGSLTVPSGTLMRHIVLIPSAGGTYKIGTTPGGEQYETGTLSGTTPYVFTYAEYSASDRDIYFTGTFTVKIYIA